MAKIEKKNNWLRIGGGEVELVVNRDEFTGQVIIGTSYQSRKPTHEHSYNGACFSLTLDRKATEALREHLTDMLEKMG